MTGTRRAGQGRICCRCFERYVPGLPTLHTTVLLTERTQCETFTLKSDSPETHGSSGPLGVSYGGCPLPITEELLKTAEDRGYPIVDDAQDLKTVNVFAVSDWL